MNGVRQAGECRTGKKREDGVILRKPGDESPGFSPNQLQISQAASVPCAASPGGSAACWDSVSTTRLLRAGSVARGTRVLRCFNELMLSDLCSPVWSLPHGEAATRRFLCRAERAGAESLLLQPRPSSLLALCSSGKRTY